MQQINILTFSENEDPADECNVEIRTTRKQTRTQMVAESDSDAEQRRVSRTSKTFLNSNGEKVTGVDDVLDRMRNADNGKYWKNNIWYKIIESN